MKKGEPRVLRIYRTSNGKYVVADHSGWLEGVWEELEYVDCAEVLKNESENKNA